MDCNETSSKTKKLYSVQTTIRFSPRVFLQAYSGNQAKLIANKILSGYWTRPKEELEIPPYAHYLDSKGNLRQKIGDSNAIQPDNIFESEKQI